VGGFVIDAAALVREGYLAMDPSGDVRLKFIHGHDGVVYLGCGLKKKSIPVGRA
jgi:hypothetical protein